MNCINSCDKRLLRTSLIVCPEQDKYHVKHQIKMFYINIFHKPSLSFNNSDIVHRYLLRHLYNQEVESLVVVSVTQHALKN